MKQDIWQNRTFRSSLCQDYSKPALFRYAKVALLATLSFFTSLACLAEPDTAAKELINRLPADTETHWITATSGDQFLILLNRNRSPRQFGTAILIPGYGHHANWPGAINQLRNYLPSHGWTTVSVSMVPKTAGSKIDGTSTDNRSAAMKTGTTQPTIIEKKSPDHISYTAGDTSGEQPPKTIDTNSDRIAKTIDYSASNLRKPFTIITEEDSAATTLKAVRDAPGMWPIMVVLINAHPSTELNDLISGSRTPIIEVVAEQHPQVEQAIMRSKLLSQKKVTNHFFNRIPTATANFSNQEEMLLKRVRGMMMRLLE